jgi:hypothetical protein
MYGITIRVATPDDLEMLSELIAASYAMLDNGAYEPERLAAALPIMSRANPKLLVSGTYFVAEADGEPEDQRRPDRPAPPQRDCGASG